MSKTETVAWWGSALQQQGGVRRSSGQTSPLEHQWREAELEMFQTANVHRL
jgi:hypothetical protein